MSMIREIKGLVFNSDDIISFISNRQYEDETKFNVKGYDISILTKYGKHSDFTKAGSVAQKILGKFEGIPWVWRREDSIAVNLLYVDYIKHSYDESDGSGEFQVSFFLNKGKFDEEKISYSEDGIARTKDEIILSLFTAYEASITEKKRISALTITPA